MVTRLIKPVKKNQSCDNSRAWLQNQAKQIQLLIKPDNNSPNAIGRKGDIPEQAKKVII